MGIYNQLFYNLCILRCKYATNAEKIAFVSNQNNDNLDKIKNCIAFVIGNVFK